MTRDKTGAFAAIVATARRQQILDAAAKVFAQKGFRATTIHDIAQEAGIADGTVYNYFENKTALLLGVLDRLNETEQRPAHFATAASDAPGFLPAYLQHRLAQFDDGGLDLLRVVLPELLVDGELRERYRREVLAPTFALGEHYLRQSAAADGDGAANAQFSSRALAGAVLGLLVLRLLGDEFLEAHWSETPAWLSRFILGGLAALGEQPDGDDNPDPRADQPGKPGV